MPCKLWIRSELFLVLFSFLQVASLATSCKMSKFVFSLLLLAVGLACSDAFGVPWYPQTNKQASCQTSCLQFAQFLNLLGEKELAKPKRDPVAYAQDFCMSPLYSYEEYHDVSLQLFFCLIHLPDFLSVTFYCQLKGLHYFYCKTKRLKKLEPQDLIRKNEGHSLPRKGWRF